MARVMQHRRTEGVARAKMIAETMHAYICVLCVHILCMYLYMHVYF